MERISSGWSDSTGEDIDGNDLEIRSWSQIVDENHSKWILGDSDVGDLRW